MAVPWILIEMGDQGAVVAAPPGPDKSFIGEIQIMSTDGVMDTSMGQS